MKREKKILIPILLILTAFMLFFMSCRNYRQKDADQSYENFSFRKIQQYIDDSAHYFRAIDSVYAYLPYPQRLYEAYGCKRGYYYTHKRDYARALMYSDSMLMIVKQLRRNKGYMHWYATALSYKADDLHALERYDEAFGFYFLAREAILKTGNLCQRTNSTTSLGKIAYKRKRYAEAARFFKEAYVQRSDCDHNGDPNKEHTLFANQQADLDNIGICYSRLNMHDSAIYYFDSALSYIRYNAHKAFRYNAQNQKVLDTALIESATAVIYGNLAKDAMETGNDSLAERLLKESIRINSLPRRAVEDVPWSLAKLADLYIRQKRVHEAEPVLFALERGLDSFPSPELTGKWNLMQSRIAGENNDFRKANRYLTRYMKISDSIEIAERGVLSPDINKELNYLRNEYELDALQKEDDLKTIYLIVTAMGAAMAVLVMLLIWRNYRQSKKHIAVLAGLNKKVSGKHAHLAKAFSALENSHAENSRMMKVVAHDLRNPVGGIAGMSDFLLKEDNYLPGQRKMLEMISKAGHHAVQLIEELLHTSQQRNNVNKVPVDLAVLVAYCAEMLAPKAAEKNQSIKLQTLPCTVHADREKLWRVFSNLIGNALKFGPEESVIDIDFSLKDNRVTVAVKDRGIGIPGNLKEKIFKMTADSKRLGTSGEPSYGLGLAICRQIMDAHEGKLWFESRQGGGTVFYVSFACTATSPVHPHHKITSVPE
ncbi:tetratricopeptide repeat-containing sensor histidine kinase [Agriterribacter sp.]|uniref:tetratricopeptide repeat-containing sensor histidine kinase n=1 Tax=Agriterribacter sp. TaxID=2821509 RepID=UPI002BC736F7|nr:tetratricopeptide repeat-containing sensor histidine kinase [Agriterribacter sp.]HRP57543.1 tetratricopeptide repeat-containing sensor histidine kinase [Agriterribacter sp.]